ncbi:hypothetical protein B0H21DRAFT_719393 [Amylocystis lapponica]|nr:hypothetical protein B0H21DRAFT_719393 [Amylocystis lapponica]
MADASCGICLDELKEPVSTPCGHLHCEKCLTEYIKASSDAISASCPTCRTTFHVVTPDKRYVSAKYHKFLVPSIRRVYLDVSAQSPVDLRVKVGKLEDRVKALMQDKELVMQRCESAMAASKSFAERERDARQESERLRKENERLEKELRELRKKYGGLKGKYTELKQSSGNVPAPATVPARAVKRKSSLFDGFAETSSSPDTTGDPGGAFGFLTRSAIRVPKRPRLLGSPFDPEKAVPMVSAFATFAGRPPVFKSRRCMPRRLDEPDSSVESLLENSSSSPDVVSSSGGPQRSGLPMGDLFSPRNGSEGSICFGGRRGSVIQEED